MRKPARLDFGSALRALAWSYFTNVAAGSLVGLGWLGSAAWGRGFAPALFALGALVSTVALLAIAPFLGLALLAVLGWSARALGWITAFVWTLFLAALYADTVIYGLFRYHFNGMVWNVMTTPGAEDAVILSAGTLWTVAIGGLFVLALERWAWARFFVQDVRRSTFSRRRRSLKWAAGALLGVVVLEKATFAWADLHREREVTALAGLFPMYQRFTVEKLAGKVFGMDLAARPEVDVTGGGILLEYPLEAPRVDPKGPRPNVLLIVVDSLRADMLAEATMPRLTEFAQRARVFEDHLSGGNATRYGVFSIVYGLHGAYWKPVLEEHAPPVLVTTLAGLGYDLRVLSGPSQNYPEFRSTCWVTIEDKVEDKLVLVHGAKDKIAAKLDGDREVVARFSAWMEARKEAATKPPFFAFALLDAPHGSYAWPRDEGTWFEPVAESVDYLQLARSPTEAEIAPVRNMFANAVRWSDANVAAMLGALERSGELANTLVIVTGDHGEEFFEHGFFGHTSNFAAEQTRVTFVMSGPGVSVGRETRPTSHLDVAPTILELLGADPAQRERWCTGENLLAPLEHRARAIASWDELALRIDGDGASGGILRIPIEGHKGLIEAYDAQWNRHSDEDSFVRAHAPDVARLALECRRFLR
ncbi:MAG: sulfatase-like hydrolase/transferase [Planctomycetes bacterium]|nr:sulfatase-like hydrolase/transferase [Planctomycetota bacterium]